MSNINLDDIPDLEAELSSDDDLPSFGPCKTKLKVKSAKKTAAYASTTTTTTAAATREYTPVSGKTDAVDLPNASGYTGSSKSQFAGQPGPDLAGRDTEPMKHAIKQGSKEVAEPSPATRGGLDRPLASAPAGAQEDDEEEAGLLADLTEAHMENVIEQILPEDEQALRAQFEQELATEDFGLPDFKNGDYGKGPKPKPTRVVAKGQWSGSTNPKTGFTKTRAQLLKEGKEVLSEREQREAKASAATKKSAGAASKPLLTTAPTGARPQVVERAAAPVAKHTCAGCKKPASSGDLVQALSATWHATCFRCQGCRADFPTGKFVNVKQKPYCRTCAVEAAGAAAAASSGDNCKACQTAIQGAAVEALGGQWCRACFVCTHCGKPFPGGRFSSAKGEPFCNQDCFEAHLRL